MNVDNQLLVVSRESLGDLLKTLEDYADLAEKLRAFLENNKHSPNFSQNDFFQEMGDSVANQIIAEPNLIGYVTEQSLDMG